MCVKLVGGGLRTHVLRWSTGSGVVYGIKAETLNTPPKTSPCVFGVFFFFVRCLVELFHTQHLLVISVSTFTTHMLINE